MKNILIIPGDGPEREFITRAGNLLTRFIPPQYIRHAEFGRASWELTNEVYPAETEDAVMETDIILCGRADVKDLGKKNPVDTIIAYSNLYARITQFSPLIKSHKIANLSVATPILSSTHQVHEVDTYYGTESTFTTSSDDMSRITEKCIELCRGRDATTAICVSSREFFPKGAKVSESAFKSVIPSDFTAHCMTSTEAAEYLFQKQIGNGGHIIIGDVPATAAVRGIAYGLTGGAGLMPETLVGDNLSVHCPSLDTTPDRMRNPTSVYLALANILIDIGRKTEGKRIRDSLREVYAQKMLSRDYKGRNNVEVMNEIEAKLFPGCHMDTDCNTD